MKNFRHEFTAVFERAPEGGYAVYIPSLPGCISEGDTLEQAEKNIREAAELYLEESPNQAVEQTDAFTLPVRI